MIADLRVDDRLIHGQIALVWTKKLDATAIVVANDAASMDKVQQMTLKMAVPQNVKLAIKSLDESVALLNNPKAKNMRIFVLVNKVEDALYLVERVAGVKRVNVANAGRFDGVKESEKLKLNSTVLLNQDEVAALEKLVKTEMSVVSQVVPDNSAKDMRELFAAKL